MRVESRRHFIWLNAEAAHLNLLVDPPEKGDPPIGQETGSIPRLEKPLTQFVIEAIRNEPLCCQLRAVAITARHTDTPDVKFTSRSLGTWLPDSSKM